MDVTALKTAVDALAAQAEKTRGTEESAGVVIAGIQTQVVAAVTKAIQENDDIDNSAIAPIVGVINDTFKVFADSDAALGAAVAANQDGGGEPTPTTRR